MKAERKGGYYRGGIIPAGEKYVSVTTVLQAVGKPALVAWSAKVEREMVIAKAARLYGECNGKPEAPSTIDFALRLERLLGAEKAHTKELEKAGAIGSSIHELVEWSLRAELLVAKCGAGEVADAEGFYVIEDALSNTLVRRFYVSRETCEEAILHLVASGNFGDWRCVEFVQQRDVTRVRAKSKSRVSELACCKMRG